jgi:hypothetical protein
MKITKIMLSNFDFDFSEIEKIKSPKKIGKNFKIDCKKTKTFINKCEQISKIAF